MARKSSKPDIEKTLYQRVRESCGYDTRQSAADDMQEMGFPISHDRLEKIENGRLTVQSSDIRAMVKCYQAPELYNYYCTHDCEFSKDGDALPVQIKEIKDIAQATLETVNSVNRLKKLQERLMEIVEDGDISDDEIGDFQKIKTELDRMQRALDSLQLWMDKMILKHGIEQS